MERRDEILKKAVAYLLEEGISETTLRPLARKTGTSARLLVYHFGSKERLLAAAINEVQAHFQRFFADAFRRCNAISRKQVLMVFWKWTTRPQNLRYFRLLFEVQAVALQNPARYGPSISNTASGWLALIEKVLPPSSKRRARATLCAAVFDGLITELLATGERRRITAALEEFNRLLVTTPPARRTTGSINKRRARAKK